MQGYLKNTSLGKKMLRPIMGFLKAGTSPRQLAVAFSLGLIVGVIPLIGSTTIICAALAFTLRLNLPALQLANYSMFPLQLLLFIPFFKLGGYFFEPLQVPVSMAQISDMIQADFFGTIQLFWQANLQALMVWVLLAVPAFLLLYMSLLLLFRKASLAISKKNNSPE